MSEIKTSLINIFKIHPCILKGRMFKSDKMFAVGGRGGDVKIVCEIFPYYNRWGNV